MTYSYTQISQYLSCPRRYRHSYLDGWQEKDTRAAMLFGRAFEQAVAAICRREDPAAVLFEQWSVCKDKRSGRLTVVHRKSRSQPPSAAIACGLKLLMLNDSSGSSFAPDGRTSAAAP
jgi:hypothetical protein